MGLYLSKPNIDKVSDYKETQQYNLAFCSAQGWKVRQDDHILVRPFFDRENSLFAIFEVHGSSTYGEYMKSQFIEKLMTDNDYVVGNFDAALINTFRQIDIFLQTKEGQNVLTDDPNGAQGGCTALIVLITNSEIYVANAGVIIALYEYKGHHKAMSTDHYAFNCQEKQRIISAGGDVLDDRLNAIFPFSRSIGDYAYKSDVSLDANRQLMISLPDVKSVDTQDCEMILLGSHGFWETFTNGGITDVIMERIKVGKPPKQILEDIVDSCIATSVESQYGLGNLSSILIIMNK